MSIHGVLQGMILAAEARVWGSSVGFLQFNLTLKPSPATYFQQPTCLNKLHARKKENVLCCAHQHENRRETEGA
jgi:hypothetical protein